MYIISYIDSLLFILSVLLDLFMCFVNILLPIDCIVDYIYLFNRSIIIVSIYVIYIEYIS